MPQNNMDFSLLPSQKVEVVKILKESKITMAKELVWDVTANVIEGMPVNGNLTFSRLVFPNDMNQNFFFCFVPVNCNGFCSEGDNWKYRFVFSPGSQKKRYEEKDDSDWSSFAYYLNMWLEILKEEVKAMKLLGSRPDIPINHITTSPPKGASTRGKLLDIES